jgi:hypothetical protein
MRSIPLVLGALLALLTSACGSSCDSCQANPCPPPCGDGGYPVPCGYDTKYCTVLDVTRMKHDDAVAALAGAGFYRHPRCIGNEIHHPDAIVKAQNPPPETIWPCDSIVELIFYPVEYKRVTPPPAPEPPPPAPR